MAMTLGWELLKTKATVWTNMQACAVAFPLASVLTWWMKNLSFSLGRARVGPHPKFQFSGETDICLPCLRALADWHTLDPRGPLR